jgi:hypothetical protein
VSKRRCKGKTRAGKACKAHPPRDSDYCRAHDPELPDSVRFGSRAQARAAGQLGGRPRNPRVVDVLRDLLEEDLREEIQQVYRDALAAERGFLIVAGQETELKTLPDHATQLKAAEALLDRAYGKPKQALEHSGAGDDDAEAVTFRLDRKTRKAIAQGLEQRAAAAATKPRKS